MSQYLLQVGNTPALTLAEAKAICDAEAQLVAELAVSFTAETDQEAKRLFDLLGAAVKLVKVDQTSKDLKEDQLEAELLKQLLLDSPTNIQFSIAHWGNLDEDVSMTSLKKSLRAENVKARFIEGSRKGLSAAVLLNQSVTELVVFNNGDQLLIGHTLAVQNIDHWTVKDRRKPYADRKKGMLPPKVARAMVNLGLGKEIAVDDLVYDPFCGTGTILLEAMERGVRVVGSDLSSKAVMGSKQNLKWFSEEMKLNSSFKIFKSQVSQVTNDQLPGKVNVIVTEPFLGKPTPQENKLPGIYKGLEKLYLGAFKQWQTLLKDGAKVVMVFPRVEVRGGATFDFKSFVDKLQPRGYTLQVDLGALRYHRKDAIVQRDIGIFTYSPPGTKRN